MRFDNKIAIVTGGLSGIGAAVAERLAAEGAKVVAADIAATATTLDTQAPIAPLRVDVADPASARAMVEAVVAAHGRVDILVQAAGIAQDVPMLETTPEQLDRILAINVRGSFLVAQAAARAMVAQKRGAIVNIASISGLRGNIGRVAYGASKGGVIVMSQVMALELAEAGVRVNVIAPGPIETPMAKQIHDEAIRNSWNRMVPMRRYGTPEEVAGATLFLCSDDASYVTGHVLTVDGGFIAAGLQR